jgi:hypothetical protein
MLKFVRSHAYSLIGLAWTIVILVIITLRAPIDAELLLRFNQIRLANVQVVYIVISGVLVLLVGLEPGTRSAFYHEGLAWLVFVSAGIASFLLIRLIDPNQEFRLFQTPFSLWLIILHGVGLCAVGVIFMTGHLPPPAEEKLRRISIGLFAIAGIVLVVLYIISRAEYMYLDLPDEPFNSSLATNFAENGDLSTAYIGEAYGSPDAVFPRYYLLMGMWLRAAGESSLGTLRAFPVMVSAVIVTIFAYGLWRLKLLKPSQILVALVFLLSLSAFHRTAHNLRMDIMLGLYAVLLLFGFIGFFGSKQNQVRWLWLMGLALFLGMQGIPTTAVPISFAAGLMLAIRFVTQPEYRLNWRYVVIYLAACALGLAAYYLLQFLPDITSSYQRYRDFVSQYANFTGVGSLHEPLKALIGYIGRFTLILSPAELPAGLLALLSMWRISTGIERRLLITLGIGLGLMSFFFFLSYSYMVVFAPFVAYALARLYQSRRAIALLTFVLLPALASAPIHDMLWAMRERRNQTRIEAVDALTPLFPEGITVIGDDLMWFTLHRGRNYVAMNGLYNYAGIHQVDLPTAVQRLEVDVLVCLDGDPQCAPIVETGLFAAPEPHIAGTQHYLIYWRKLPTT